MGIDRLYKILMTALLVETLSITWGLHVPALAWLMSVFYVLAGITIVYAWLYPAHNTLSENNSNGLSHYKWVIVVAVLLAAGWFGHHRMMEEPMSYESADMLPILKIMNERVLAGHLSQVYSPVAGIWHGITPIYLPAMWLPFALPVVMGVDLRWITVLCLFVVFVLLLKRIRLNKKQTPFLIAVIALYAWLFVDEISGLLPFSEEGVVIFYYVLLVIALQQKKAWFTGLAIALCLLSRYMLIGWIPALFVYYAWKREWKYLMHVAITIGIVVLGLFVVPFGKAVMISLLSLPASYIDFAARVWRDSPEVFTEGAGLARFFGPDHIALQHTILLVGALVIPTVVMVLLLLKAKRWNIESSRLPLAMLKMTLVIFFSLVDVPYLYLFYTSSFVSLFMLAGWLNGRKQL